MSIAALKVEFTVSLNHLVTAHECRLLSPSCAMSRWEAAEPAVTLHLGFALGLWLNWERAHVCQFHTLGSESRVFEEDQERPMESTPRL